jgi:hypothetical protein
MSAPRIEPGIARSNDRSRDQRADIAAAGLKMPQPAAQDCIEPERCVPSS